MSVRFPLIIPNLNNNDNSQPFRDKIQQETTAAAAPTTTTTTTTTSTKSDPLIILVFFFFLTIVSSRVELRGAGSANSTAAAVPKRINNRSRSLCWLYPPPPPLSPGLRHPHSGNPSEESSDPVSLWDTELQQQQEADRRWLITPAPVASARVLSTSSSVVRWRISRGSRSVVVDIRDVYSSRSRGLLLLSSLPDLSSEEETNRNSKSARTTTSVLPIFRQRRRKRKEKRNQKHKLQQQTTTTTTRKHT